MKHIIAFFAPFVVCFLLAYFQTTNGLTVILRGNSLSAVPVLFMSILILSLGIVVLLYKRGKNPKLSGISAARIYYLAFAGQFSGLILLGIWGGTLIGEFSIWQIIFSRFSGELLATISAFVLLICSIITALFCKVDPSESADADLKNKSSEIA